MRIAYVLADRGVPVFGTKGASVHVCEMVNAFAAQGHQVTLFTVRKGQQNVQLNAEIISVAVSKDSDNRNLGGDEKVKQHELYLMSLNEAIYEEILQSHSKVPFDFIYERYSLFGTAGIDVSQRLKIPSVVEVNSPLVNEQQNYRTLIHLKEAEQVEARVFEGATFLAAVSIEIRNYILLKQIDSKKIHVIPNGVNADKFHVGVNPSRAIHAKGSTVIGFVGSLKPWHGLEVLMNAFQRLAQQNPDYHLLIVGEGPLRSWIEDFSHNAGIEKQVTITGWTDHDDLPGLLKLMDIAVAPYPELKDFYFSPLKLYEYMAVGKPVIASKIGQIDSLIQDGINGLLVKPGDAIALATSIQKLSNDFELQKTIGDAAVQTVIQYTWGGNVKKVINLVKQDSQPSIDL